MPRDKSPEDTHCKSISISFEPKQLQELIEYCQRNDRSMAWVIRRALRTWLEQHKDDTIE